MDFYFDVAMAVLLRILNDRMVAAKYKEALAKLHVRLEVLAQLDQAYRQVVIRKRLEK